MEQLFSDIEENLLNIIELGLLNARYYLNKGNHVRCLTELNHIHNIPSLIKNYTPELLNFYKTVELKQYFDETECCVSQEMKHSIELLEKY